MVEEGMLEVGAAKEKIDFPENFFPIENFSYIHDSLHVRVLYLQANQSFILISLEFTSLRDYVIEELKNLVYQSTQIPKEHIWICVTHTFSAPHTRSQEAIQKSQEIYGKNQDLCQFLYSSVEKAVKKAIETKQKAYVGFGHGYCAVNVNRDVSTKAGWWLGANDLGISDKTVPIIKFEDENHQLISLLYSYDVQSSIMDGSLQKDNQYVVTSDLTGISSQYIEEQYGNDCVAMYIVGTAGDQAPIFKAKHHIIDRYGDMQIEDIHEDGLIFVKALGMKLGNQVVKACERIKTTSYLGEIRRIKTSLICSGQKIQEKRNLRPTHDYQFMKEQDKVVEIEILQFGFIVIIGVQPELSSVTGMDIRKQSPFPLTMVLTMVNGGAKYMPDQTSYDRITYEAMNSQFTKGSAEKLTNHIIQTLESIKM